MVKEKKQGQHPDGQDIPNVMKVMMFYLLSHADKTNKSFPYYW